MSSESERKINKKQGGTSKSIFSKLAQLYVKIGLSDIPGNPIGFPRKAPPWVPNGIGKSRKNAIK